MKYRFAAGMALALALTVVSTAHAEVRIAFVDIQRALNQCHNGMVAKTKFRAQVQQMQAKLEKEEAKVKSLKNELDQKAALMQPNQRQNLADEYTQQLRQFQEDVRNSRDELHEKANQLTGEIVGDLATVVRQVGEKDGYTIIFEKGTVLWAAPSIDITDQVIRTYDAMNVQPGTLAQEAANSPSMGRFKMPQVSSGSSAATKPHLATGRATITK